MPAVAAMLDSRSAMAALRRTLPKTGARVVGCRTPAALDRAIAQRLVDAIVLAPSTAAALVVASLRGRVPQIPIVAYAPFRPDDGELLVSCRRQQVTAVAVEGVDDAVVGEIVSRCSLTSARRRAMADAPRALRLTEPLQRLAWDYLLSAVEHPVRTAQLARRLEVSREYLSRQFGAGGAPNLKRVIDLTRIACAAQLLQNPAYRIGHVVKLLHFTSSSHLAGTARRITGAPPTALPEFGPRGVLLAFARGKTRSRV
jgi:AraC-like DNA-binding protein